MKCEMIDEDGNRCKNEAVGEFEVGYSPDGTVETVWLCELHSHDD